MSLTASNEFILMTIIPSNSENEVKKITAARDYLIENLTEDLEEIFTIGADYTICFGIYPESPGYFKGDTELQEILKKTQKLFVFARPKWSPGIMKYICVF